MIDPTIQMLRPIPPVSWIPVAIIWFGIANKPAIFLVFLGAFFPVFMNTVHGVKGCDRALVRAGAMMGGRPWPILRYIVFPAALPSIFAGLRIAIGSAWMLTVTAEMVAVKSGLGYMLWDSYYFLRFDLVLAAMASIGLLADLADVSVHFGRFRVTRIALADEALQQFDPAPILAAASLLADAKVDVIAWNGTSSGWLGFAADERLCALITAETGIPATTSVLALNEIMARTGVRRFGLATYTDDVQAAILANYAASGLPCVAERHLGDPGNFSFAEVGADRIEAMVREVAAARPDCISTFCTNLRAAPLVERLEQEIGLPIYDTISVVVWKSLVMAGADPSRVKGWGQLFTG